MRRVLYVLRPLLIAAVGAMIAVWGAQLLVDGLDIKIAGASMPQSINYLPLTFGGAVSVSGDLAMVDSAITGSSSSAGWMFS